MSQRVTAPVRFRRTAITAAFSAATLALPAHSAIAQDVPPTEPPPARTGTPEPMVDTSETTRTTVRTDHDGAGTASGDFATESSRNIARDAARSPAGRARRAAPADKSRYDLFNPTPRELMRPLSTDRPDVTESPYTVDAGHFQVELSFFEYARDNGGNVDEWDVLPFNVKAGLTNNVDLELLVVPYVNVDVDNPFGFGRDGSGFGPLTLRAKVNLWGNDGGGAPFDLPSNFPSGVRERWGDSAFALMPYVRFPTGSDDVGFSNNVEFGLAAPLSTPISKDWDLSLMADLGIVRGPDDGSYKLELTHTASFSRNLGGRLGGYGEYAGVLTGREGTRYLASLGVGLLYSLSRDAQLDAGVNVGLNDEAEDFRFITGISFRR
jgi:hypothetical protein